ncbi:MAG: formimidoylglutamate deiminase, partial [Bacteroidetes bacterium]|nr:formimidoylglutamate deiminase [Bacteroidota bacterium]
MQTLLFDHALLPHGWAEHVAVHIDEAGDIAEVTIDATEGERIAGCLLPGVPNLHSHAHQRAMAGQAERSGDSDDSFWTWRQTMYHYVERIQPHHLEAIAAQLYVEMLKAGYTSVAEFQYLHHDPDGQPYHNVAEMSLRTLAAARDVGIGITNLPVLYRYGGFGAQEPLAGQRRFLNDPERFLRLVEMVIGDYRGDPQVRVGIAPHSLRAVSPETLSAALEGLDALDPRAPVHIHVAEQHGEVRDCIDWSGLRPVEWLLQNAPVGPRWCLVHATHVTEEEARRLAASGAVVGLCPTTEANL